MPKWHQTGAAQRDWTLILLSVDDWRDKPLTSRPFAASAFSYSKDKSGIVVADSAKAMHRTADAMPR